MSFPEAKIGNDFLHTRLFLPDADRGYYRATRFDWAGVIYGLTCDGHDFFAPWRDTPDPRRHDSVCGPADEFGEIVHGDSVSVLKIGVGILKKNAGDVYDKFLTYEIDNPGRRFTEAGPDRIRFVHELSDDRFAYRYEKTLRLHDDSPTLSIDYRLTNDGDRDWNTNVYNHYFFVVDDWTIGPEVLVRFPFRPEGGWRDADGPGLIDGQTIRFRRDLVQEERAFIADVRGFRDTVTHHAFSVENLRTGAGVDVFGTRPLDRVVFWACRKTCCVEPFIALKIPPGETFSWQNRLVFHPFEPRERH